MPSRWCSTLPNQMIMLVGRDLGEPERFRAVVRRALMFALGMMGLGGLVIWFVVGRRALKRIDSVSEASAPHHGRRPVAAGCRWPAPATSSTACRRTSTPCWPASPTLNEGLKQVSDNIAHDLKTPLTRLRNRAEAALAGTHTPAEYRRGAGRRRSPNPTS